MALSGHHVHAEAAHLKDGLRCGAADNDALWNMRRSMTQTIIRLRAARRWLTA
jgi:hypothetical protein